MTNEAAGSGSMRLGWRMGLWLGACAGGGGVTAMLILRLWLGLPGLLDVVGSGLAILLPGPLFGALIDSLQERGRPLLLLGTAALLVVISAGWGALAASQVPTRFGRWPQPAREMATTGLLPALGLWLATLPLLVAAEGTLESAATWSTLIDWLLVAGLLAMGLRLFRMPTVQPSPIRDLSSTAISRRRFLTGAGALAGAASLGYLGMRAIVASPPPLSLPARGPEVGRLPSEITPTSEFYVVSKDLFGPPQIAVGSWRLVVRGEREVGVSYPELTAMAAMEQVQALECISNPVGGTLISNGRWRGVPLGRLLADVGVPADAHQVVFSCADGYSESLPLDQALAPTTLLATHLNGAPLPAEHGFPTRVLVTGHYGMKNPKWLTRISMQRGPYQGYWEQQGWNAAAVPHIFSRFDFPAGSTRLDSGRRYLLSGVAYGGSRGIGGVEVSFDGGATWHRARLQPTVGTYAWTVWSLPWAPIPGLYSLVVRATDRGGRLQTATAAGSYPNGATGYQQVLVVVG